MKENKKILKRKEEGITLIALVITIIVLLILAGVSIAMLTGENGILSQATNAKESTDKATEEEKVNMAVLGSSIADNGYSEILDEASFRQELTNQFGNNGYDLVVNGDGSFIITVKESQRKYYVNDDKTVINSDNIIEITSAEELANFRDDVNSGNSYEGKAVLLTSDITLSEEWEPIGFYDQTTDEKNPDTINNKPFRGIFDGGNCIINGISITTNRSYQGLFSFVVDGTIRNVKIGKNNNITGNIRVGGVVGYLYGFKGNISNCVNYSDVECVSGAGIVGIIAGQNTVFNCKNYGDITGAAGIVGATDGLEWGNFANYNEIVNCGNYGNITRATGNYCGGIAGYFKGNITNSCNKGTIIGNGNIVGGIVGSLDGNIENCYNVNDVKAMASYVGGIIGYSGSETEETYLYNKINISNCYSIGDISGKSYVGDLIGYKPKTTTIDEINCYTKNDTFTAEDLGDAYKEDIENINEGYPILFWE